MTAGYWNTVIDQGAIWQLNVVYQDSDGDPVNLTGYTAKMELRSAPNDPDAALTLSSEDGDIVITPLSGNLAITATTAQTSTVDEGVYYYDLEITNSVTSEVNRLVQGQITVSAQVTH